MSCELGNDDYDNVAQLISSFKSYVATAYCVYVNTSPIIMST